MMRIDRRVVLQALGMTIAAGPGLAAKALGETMPAARDLSLDFAVLTNLEPAGHATVELGLANRGATALPATGWTIYFDYAGGGLEAAARSGIKVEAVNGDLARLVPEAGFSPLAPGETRRFRLMSDGPVIQATDAPSGFFLVHGDTVEPIGEATLAPLTRPEQLTRGPDDKLPSVTPASSFEANKGLSLLPEADLAWATPAPAEHHAAAGTFVLTPKLRIGHDPALTNEAEFLKAALTGLLGSGPVQTAREAGDIQLRLDPSLSLPAGGIADQGYVLAVSATGIDLAAKTAAGIFHGIQSLLQRVPVAAFAGVQASIAIPAGTLRDAPRFAYRGFMLDIARNFSDKAVIQRLIDVMAHYKLNALHLHLTDDEGWRLEIPALPELTSVGSRRGFTGDDLATLPPSFGSGPVPDRPRGSGHLSSDDFVEILRYAAARHIDVIPEIDLPGHSRAAIRSMEARHRAQLAAGQGEAAEAHRLADPDDRSRYKSNQGWTDNVICIGRESVYRFLDTVIAELKRAFERAGLRLKLLHIGGDEVPEGVWEDSPLCRALMKEKGLTSTKELKAQFFTRLHSLLEHHGVAMAGWEQIALDLPAGQAPTSGTRFYVWNSGWDSPQPDVAYKLANKGCAVVVANAEEFYFDLDYEKSPEEPGQTWAGFIDTRKVFEADPLDRFAHPAADTMGHPIPTEKRGTMTRLTETGRTHVLGIQGHLWSETVKTDARVKYMALPRLIALAERGWSARPAEIVPAWNEFANRLGQHDLPRLDHLFGGLQYRVPVPGATVGNGRCTANIEAPGITIRYTTDGTDPVETSPAYTGPVDLPAGGTIRLAAFTSTGRRGRVVTASA